MTVNIALPLAIWMTAISAGLIGVVLIISLQAKIVSESKEKHNMTSKRSIVGVLIFFLGVAGIIRLIDSLARRNKNGAMNRDRFDKFTERARKVLRLAQEEAQRLQHNYIGTEHLLLGLVRK